MGERERDRERGPSRRTRSRAQHRPARLWPPVHGDAVTWNALWWRAPQPGLGRLGPGEEGPPLFHHDRLWAQAGLRLLTEVSFRGGNPA